MEHGLNHLLFGDDPPCAFDYLTEEELEAIERDEDYHEEYNPEEDE